MSKTRLEAFSDGVIAILITIMVLELRVPEGDSWQAFQPAVPSLLVYILSFAILGIYWNNHHHLLYAAERINGAMLWANLHLLFWLSLIPFGTAWMAENHFAPLPTAFYGLILLLSAVAYWILVNAIIGHHGPDSRIARAIGRDKKGKMSMLLYAAGIALAFTNPRIADAIYVMVALMWLVPDRRIERKLEHPERVR